MGTRGALVIAALLASPAIAGCLDGPAPPADPASSPGASFPACEHPWPCADGSEWPTGLDGPFQLDGRHAVEIESHDGTALQGTVWMPDLPEDVQAPVVVWSHPYFGGRYPHTDDPQWWNATAASMGLDVRQMIQEGYALLFVAGRGSNTSEGCLDYWGPTEQADQVAIVNWAANQTWSNGRVAMAGLSWHGTTPWEAAIHDPEPLKTIVTAGIISDVYTLLHTPQGATFYEAYLPAETLRLARMAGPPALGLAAAHTGDPNDPEPRPTPNRTNAERATADWLDVASERACPSSARWIEDTFTGTYDGDRAADWYDERRLIDGMDEVRAAVLLAHGFRDNVYHGFQEDLVWQTLPEATPRHQFEGMWRHTFPPGAGDASLTERWTEEQVDWLAFWLKGQGPPPDGLDTAVYRGSGTGWRTADAWPPADRQPEVLHLAGGDLSSTPTRGDLSFRSILDPQGIAAAQLAGLQNTGPMCPRPGADEGPRTFQAFRSEPAEEAVLAAGHPFVHLNITTDQPGGLVAVSLVDLGPEFRCDAARQPQDVTWLTYGAADLRYHDGTFEAEDFPTGTPASLRIDLMDIAFRLEQGHQLGVLVSYGDGDWRPADGYTPEITVHGNSELIVPVVEGSLGGKAPTKAYPPRPLAPN